jgi:amidase
MRLRLIATALLGFLTTAATAQTTRVYIVTLDNFGSKTFWKLTLNDNAGKLTGDLDGDIVEGTRTNDQIKFHAYDKNGGTEDVNATISLSGLKGTVLWLQDGDPPAKATLHNFTAETTPLRAPGSGPSLVEFTPDKFYRQFSADIAPVLHLWPGDSLHTTTVDAGGTDEKGNRRVAGGNPETGPFYIEGAMPGDRLVVHIKRLKLNRDYAISDDGVVSRALSQTLAVKMKDNMQDVRWHLDLEKNVATTDHPGEHLKAFTVPLKPMLGCIATAPRGNGVAIPSQDSGYFGGNMDFNEVTEGATVYLPVNVPGALLFFGDGHAAQGDGELNGNALETSMDVEITVDLLHGKHFGTPFVENDTYIMATGYEGSIDDSFKTAVDNMVDWLEDVYKLTPSESAQVLGTSAEVKLAEAADRNAGVAIKLRKDRLATIPKASATSPAK